MITNYRFQGLVIGIFFLLYQTTMAQPENKEELFEAIIAKRIELLQTLTPYPYTAYYQTLIKQANQSIQQPFYLRNNTNKQINYEIDWRDSLFATQEFFLIDGGSNKIEKPNSRGGGIFLPKTKQAFTYWIEKDTFLTLYVGSFDLADIFLSTIKGRSIFWENYLVTHVKKDSTLSWQVSCTLYPFFTPSIDSLSFLRIKKAYQYVQAVFDTSKSDRNFLIFRRNQTTLPLAVEVKALMPFAYCRPYVETFYRNEHLTKTQADSLANFYEEQREKQKVSYCPMLKTLTPSISSCFELYFEPPSANRIACVLLYNGLRYNTFKDAVEGNQLLTFEFYFDEKDNIKYLNSYQIYQ